MATGESCPTKAATRKGIAALQRAAAVASMEDPTRGLGARRTQNGGPLDVGRKCLSKPAREGWLGDERGVLSDSGGITSRAPRTATAIPRSQDTLGRAAVFVLGVSLSFLCR